MKHFYIYLFLCLGLLPLAIKAQEKKIDFFGSGRFTLNNSSLSGKLIDKDTTTARKQMTGTTLFDLGFHIRPSENTEIKAITRVQNEINGFWGGGIIFNLRELYLRGLMFNRIKYQVGDLNTRMTAYTLFNNNGELSQSNPAAFNTFSEVINYDKFYGQNSWRQQGATANIGFDFDKYLNHINITSLITKNRQTDYFSSPDRLFSGSTIQAKLFNQLNLAYNYTNTFDVENSAMFSNALFNNSVNSFEIKELFNLNKLKIDLNAELGQSNVNFKNNPTAPSIKDGMFLDGGLNIENKKSNWNFGLNLRSVETTFRSVGAQSRRVDFNAVASEYPYYTNRESVRPINLLSVLTDGNYYNMFLSPTLRDYNPAYENMLPYGKATPNRQGADLKFGWNHSNKNLIKISGSASFYNEITGQGTTAIRDFTNLEIMADLGVNELYKGKKKVHVGVFVKQQNTGRTGTEGIDKIDLKTSQIKVGFEYEILPNLDLQLACILLNAKGNEFLAQRNSFNEIIFYKSFNADLQETILLGGINYQFSKNNCLKIQYQQADWNNKLLTDNQYTINRLAVIYNLFF
jgi:hypothetical protein